MYKFRISDNYKHAIEFAIDSLSEFLDRSVLSLIEFRCATAQRTHQGNIQKDVWLYPAPHLHWKWRNGWYSTKGKSNPICEAGDRHRLVVPFRSAPDLDSVHELDVAWLLRCAVSIGDVVQQWKEPLRYDPNETLRTVESWCEKNGYSDSFKADYKWWAFPPGAVMPVQLDWRNY
jgi:hypothetical protein